MNGALTDGPWSRKTDTPKTQRTPSIWRIEKWYVGKVMALESSSSKVSEYHRPNHHQSNNYCGRVAKASRRPHTRSWVIHGGTGSASWRRRRQCGVRKITAFHQSVYLDSYGAFLKSWKCMKAKLSDWENGCIPKYIIVSHYQHHYMSIHYPLIYWKSSAPAPKPEPEPMTIPNLRL